MNLRHRGATHKTRKKHRQANKTAHEKNSGSGIRMYGENNDASKKNKQRIRKQNVNAAWQETAIAGKYTTKTDENTKNTFMLAMVALEV